MAICLPVSRYNAAVHSEPKLMTGVGDVKKGHSINGLSHFYPPGFLYNYCKEGLDKKPPISIFLVA